MITTIVDKNYLYKECQYLLQSISKYMPDEKVYLFLVNCDDTVKEDILKWHSNTTIDFRIFDIPQEQYRSYMYVMMTFIFDWLLNEKKINENIIYLDADIVLKGTIINLYKELQNYDLMFRYHPFNRIKGPTTDEFGGIMNNGCIAIKNNTVMAQYAKQLKQNIQNYLDTKKDPVIFVKEANVITCIDQEMAFTTYLSLKDKIKFFPLDNIYNDTQYTKKGIVWHAKGVLRTYPEYLIECAKYDKNYFVLTKQYIKLLYRQTKKLIKSFLIEPNSFYIAELNDILTAANLKDVIIINSNYYLDNQKSLKEKNVICYETNPVIYYNNKTSLRHDNIQQYYINNITEYIDHDNCLLICGESDLIIQKNLSQHLLIKTKTNKISANHEYRLSNNYLLISPKIVKIIKVLQENSYKYAKYIHPKWNNYIVDLEVQLFIDYLILKGTKKDIKILEIGAGDGYCSYKFNLAGFKNIISTDIEPRFPSYYDVLQIESELPFDDNEFDLIISMNVLEHIENVNFALCEMARVLKNDGIMLHSMPTPYINLITILLLPLNYFRNIFYILTGFYLNKYKPLQGKNVLRFIRFVLTLINPIKLFYYNGHGLHGMFSSFYHWRYSSWKQKFQRNKLKIVDVKGLKLFLSLLKLFPFKFQKFRESIGNYLPSVNLYILKKENNDTKRP